MFFCVYPPLFNFDHWFQSGLLCTGDYLVGKKKVSPLMNQFQDIQESVLYFPNVHIKKASIYQMITTVSKIPPPKKYVTIEDDIASRDSRG